MRNFYFQKISIGRILLWVIPCFIFFQTSSAQNCFEIIPAPVSCDKCAGNDFQLSPETSFVLTNQKDSTSVRIFNDYLFKNYGFRLKTEIQSKKEKNVIVLLNTNGRWQNDLYSVMSTEKHIEIKGSDAGIFYGLQTLLQLLPDQFSLPLSIPCCLIDDSSHYEWRGMHLDCSRHFFTKEEVKLYIDYLARYKFNTFHWHLTDDQGWRIEIKQFPKLTQIGAWRNGTLIGHYSEHPQFDSIRYGGFYTQEDVKEIVAYASERFITVVPEIEMPGHAMTALASYPEYSCTGGPFEVAKNWGVYDDVFCPKEETFAFLDSILSEVMQLFPSKYIHIGGDECPKVRWKQCDHCQQLMKQLALKNEIELQSYFTQRIEKFVNSRGRNIIGWDEILEGGLAPNAAVMSWRGMEGGIEAASQNHNVVMSPGEFCYFDYYQSRDADEPLAIGGYLPIKKVYAFIPSAGIPDDKKQFILGGQANLWTEYISKFSQVEYMIFPRMCAMSEALWSKPTVNSQKEYDYTDFERRLILYHFKWFNQQHINYSKAIISPVLMTGSPKKGDGILVDVSNTWSSAKTFYSLDGSAPSINLDFDSAFHVTKDALVKIHVIDTAIGIDKTLQQQFHINKATGKKYLLFTKASEKYNLGDLTDGIVGRIPWHGEEWTGFSGGNLEMKIDLGDTISFSEITVGVLEDKSSWIYLPKKITVMISNDGENFEPIKTTTWDEIQKSDHRNIIIHFTGVNAQYVVVKAENLGVIPEGNPGAGHAAWLFVDEIGIK